MPPLSILIKPASSLCNLRCKYCFYHDEASKRTVKSYGIMQSELLEILVKRALEEASGSVTFAFQGGEPTLAGLDYFKKLNQFIKQYNKKKLQISYAIQTNGMVIDAEWAEFFHDNHYLVGLSLDGTKEIHDFNRIDTAGKGTFQRVLQTARLFNQKKVDYNILTVINAFTARHIAKIYSFYKKQGFQYLQFIPCLDPIEEEPFLHEWSLTPERYLQYLKTLFDLWYTDQMQGRIISIRQFDNYLGMLLGHAPESCGMMGMCGIQNIIEADGSVYPCDFYGLDAYQLGNIRENSFQEIFECATAQNFMKRSCVHPEQCKTCEWYALCRNGCYRMQDANGHSLYCKETKEFFSYTYSRFCSLADAVKKKRLLS